MQPVVQSTRQSLFKIPMANTISNEALFEPSCHGF
jgi:hypothetical protein